jgi:hypothetical protein
MGRDGWRKDAQIAVMFLMILCTYVGEQNCYEMYCTSFDVDCLKPLWMTLNGHPRQRRFRWWRQAKFYELIYRLSVAEGSISGSINKSTQLC